MLKSNSHRSDRRVRRTQKAIEQAFAELMSAKDISSITVSELAEKADIHRATFYSHYSDIPELYEVIQRSVIDDLEKILEPDPVKGKNMNSEEVLGMLVDYIYGRRDTFKMLLTRNSTHAFYVEASKLFEPLYLEIFWGDLEFPEGRYDTSLFAKYHIQGCIAVLGAWAEDDFKDTPEKIIDTLADLDSHFDQLMYRIASPGN
ncbi:MAG: TetR/AcrR family transcriptional regulator C-terminal domain-containing protein [Rothia sp. (in: high G+C Gram-positive bacteria)]|nr:TetR/AcrR family transcriptional regulator C-terminal domain-containing protein [Rothia sp. (in: high G+C Gram-positive bacteria)]